MKFICKSLTKLPLALANGKWNGNEISFS